jgi:para-nitrobenzyl esterase
VTGAGERARSLSARMADAWVHFARTGDPNHAGLPRWTPYSARGDTMVFDDRCALEHAPDGAEQAAVRAAVGL